MIHCYGPVQSCLFIHFCLEIFLVQCWGNLCNIGAAFAATGYYQNTNRSNIKIAKKRCCSLFRRQCTKFFSCVVLPGVSWVLHRDFTSAILSQCTTTTLNIILSCEMLAEALWTTLPEMFACSCAKLSQENSDNKEKDFACAMLSGASRTTLHRVFLVQCCPRRIKTTLHGTFSCSMLHGASWPTLRKVFICAMLHQEY